MSFTLEIRGTNTAWWPLSSACLEQIEKARRSGGQHAIEVIFGDEHTQDGTKRLVDRKELSRALEELLPLIVKFPSGFQVWSRPIAAIKEELPSRGASGLLIGGKYHTVGCSEDYWTLQPTEELREGKEPVKQYQPAEIPTENMGVVLVKAKKPRRSDLAKLLRDVRKSLKTESQDVITVVWG